MKRIKLAMRPGIEDEFVDAHVFGVWAVHSMRFDGRPDCFRITHVPTGRGLTQTGDLTEDEAVRVAELLATRLPWKRYEEFTLDPVESALIAQAICAEALA